MTQPDPKSWNTDNPQHFAVFCAALTGIIANPNGAILPKLAVEYANDIVLAAIKSNGGANDPD